MNKIIDNPTFGTILAAVFFGVVVIAFASGWLAPVEEKTNQASCWRPYGDVAGAEICR